MTNVVPLQRRPFGATADEWRHFELILGPADLLPVVSRPGAPISPQSTLKGLGKTPSTYNGNRQVVGLPKWTSRVSTAADVDRWMKELDHGICIQCRLVRALDIDVPNPDLADQIEATFLEAAGVPQLPVRSRSGTGKRLLAFEVVGELPKRSFRLRDGQGLVEFLGNGQQFIAIGAHFNGDGTPSGSRYEWLAGLPIVIPRITQEVFERAWLAIVERFAAEVTEGEAGVDRQRPDLDDVDDPVAEYLSAKGIAIGAQDEKVFVQCPWKEGHSSDSGVSETCWLVAGTKGFQQGHFQCMHASCAKRTDVEFLDAIGYRAAAFGDLSKEPEGDDAAAGVPRLGEPNEPYLEPWPKFKRDGKGAIEAALGNVVMALTRGDLCGFKTLVYDAFRDDLLWNGRPFKDADAVKIRMELEARGFKPVGRELMRDALLQHGETHRIDSAQEWLAGLPAWDGVERVETFLPRLFSVGDTPYTRACSRYVWSAMAGRIIEPGVKADMAVILQGEQGQLKSWAVQALSPPELQAFRKITLHKIDADLSRKLRGCLVGELDELRGLRTRDAESIRSWMSDVEERWVEKWQSRETSFLRRCILWATANPQELLDDETGERRWLPMTVGSRIDLEAVQAERDQLWAEGAWRFRLLGVEWQDAERLARGEHAAFKVRDSWVDLIERYLEDETIDGTTIEARGWVQIVELGHVIGKGYGALTPLDEKRIGKALRTLGWRSGPIRINGKAKWGWRKG